MTSSGLFQKEKYFYAFDRALQNSENMLKNYLLASQN